MKVWSVVPVKPFAVAKQRLADVLQPWERVALSRLMLHDTLKALAQVDGLAGRLVVTADPDAAAIARGLGADVLPEHQPEGLNAAVTRAAQHVHHGGGQALLVVPGDVPGLRARELAALIDSHAMKAGSGAALSLVPAHDGEGTNAWLVSPPQALAPAFGPDSFVRHQSLARAAGLAVHCRAWPSLALDLDRAGDLARFAADPQHALTLSARFLTPRGARLPALQRVEV